MKHIFFLASIVLGLAFGTSAQAATNLTVTPVTWNIIGLDSNSPASGPNHFPVGARVCNSGTTAATSVVVSFAWDDGNGVFTGDVNADPYINLRSGSLSSITIPSLSNVVPNNCYDAYFEVEVAKISTAFDKTRRYHMTATDSLGVTGTSLQPRELYVEHLVSQSRNGITSMKLDGTTIPAGGSMTLMVGNTYTIELAGFTATQGYNQLESFINFPNTIFQILSVSTTYSADNSPYVPGPFPAANDKLYADACLWENDPNSPNYRSCVGGDYKAGGSNVITTYTVKILSGAGTSQALNSMLYDFSGSSFHYNSDYAVGARIANIIDSTNVSISKSFSPNPTNVNGVSAVTISLTNPNPGTISGYNFTDLLPANLTVGNPPAATTTGCGTPTFSPIAGAGSISFSNGTLAANSSCIVKVDVTASATGPYINTTNNLFIYGLDTGKKATANLTVNSDPPPGTGLCGLLLASWDFPVGFSTAAPAPTVANVSASASPGTGINPVDSTTNHSGTTHSWSSRGGIATGAGLNTTNNDYFQFAINTTSYSTVYLSFWARRTNNGPQGLAVYYGTSPGNPETGTPIYTNGAALGSAGTWVQFGAGNSLALTVGSGTTYVRLYGFNSNNTNPGADLYIDDVTFTGCGAPIQPTISKSFSPSPVAVGGTSTLTFTLTNTNTAQLTGAKFTDTLPVGLQVAAPPSATTTCTGTPTWAPLAGDTTLNFGQTTGANIPASGSCTVSVNVTATTAGPHANVSGFLSTMEGGTNTKSVASASLTAVLPPGIAKQFAPTPILPNGISTLTFTITNPNQNDSLNGVAFSDTFPASPGNMVVAIPPSASTSGCGSPTFSPVAGSGSISFSGGTIVGGSTCTVTVNVRAPAVGTYNNTSGNVSHIINAATVNGNTASASLTVNPPHPAIAMLKQVSTSATGPWTSYLGLPAGGNFYYRFTIENIGDVPLNPVTVSDPILAGTSADPATCSWTNPLPVASPTQDPTETCVKGPMTATSGSHANTATAHGTHSGTVYDSVPSTATYATTGLTIAKSVTEAYFTSAGNLLHYSYAVTNSGFAPLVGPVTVADDKSTDETCPEVSTVGDHDNYLDPGESITCTATYTVQAADVTAGFVTNTASASVGGVTSVTDSKTVNLTPADLSVTKTDRVASVNAGGSTTYIIVVSNAGPFAAGGAVLKDPAVAGLTKTGTPTCGSATGGAVCPWTVTNALLEGAGVVIPTLPPGGSVTFTIFANVTIGGGSVANTATVTAPSGVTDPNPGNNSATDTDMVNPVADLSITKTDGATTYTPGTNVVYTVVVGNGGPSNVVGATVTDSAPVGAAITGWSAVFAGGASGNGSGTGNISELVSIPSGGGITYTITVNVPSFYTGNLVNTATVSVPGGVTDNNLSNNSATDMDTQRSVADLSITKSSTPKPYVPGAALTYTIVVTNLGPSDATNARVQDALPAALSGFTWTCVAGAGASCGTGSGTGDIDTLVTLPVGTQATFTVTGTVPSGTTGALVNTATVAAPLGVTDPVPGNNSASDTSPIGAVSDLRVTKSSTPEPYVPGAAFTYTIVVTNAGPSDAIDARVQDALPAALSAFTWTCVASGIGASCGTGSGTGDIDALVTLPAGTQATFTVTGTVPSGTTGELINTATVAAPAGTTDPVPGNNSASDTSPIGAVSDLSITKVSNPGPYVPGVALTYTIVVTNLGPSDVTDARVQDALPGALSGFTWTCVAGAGASCGTGSGAGDIDTLVTLPVGTQASFTVTGTVPSSATGALANTATVSAPAGVTDPVPGNNTATDTNGASLQADLSITKTDGATTYTPGTNVVYTVVVSNGGPSNVVGATVSDSAPVGATITGWSAVFGGGATGNGSGAGNISELVNIPSGGSITYTITVNVPSSYTGNLVNTATVAAPGGVTDNNPGNNTATDTDTQGSVADLAVTKSSSPKPYVPGAALTYTIVVSNVGPSDATNARVQDALPAPLSAFTWTCAASGIGASCGTGSGAGDIDALVTLPVGTQATFTVTGTVPSGTTGALVNTATVAPSLGTTDPVPGNNTATDTNGASVQADLSITKTDGSTSYTPGTNVVYTVVVGNGGPSNVVGATVADAAPAGTTLSAWTAIFAGGATGTGSGTGNISELVNIPAGGSITYTITVSVPSSYTGNLVNTATVAVPGGVTDNNPGNNSATDTDTQSSVADLSITKTDSPDPVTAGQSLTYTVTVNNAGPSIAQNVVATDTLPGGVTVLATSGCAEDPGGVPTCSLGTINVGGSKQYTITVRVIAGIAGTLTNQATVSSSTPDPNMNNNSASSTTTVMAIPPDNVSLSVSKTVSGDRFPVLRYVITIVNIGNVSAQSSVFADSIPANAAYVANSIRRNGNMVSDAYPDGDGGYDQNNNRIVVNLGTLNPGGQISVIFEVSVNSGFSGTISNQGIVSGGNFPDILTDDPGTAIFRDPTLYQTPAPSVPVPTLTEWGMILFMLLAGLGSFFHLRRIRRGLLEK